MLLLTNAEVERISRCAIGSRRSRGSTRKSQSAMPWASGGSTSTPRRDYENANAARIGHKIPNDWFLEDVRD
jgi:hypothetical protein